MFTDHYIIRGIHKLSMLNMGIAWSVNIHRFIHYTRGRFPGQKTQSAVSREMHEFHTVVLSNSVGNRRGKSQSIIEKVKLMAYRLYNQISQNSHQIIEEYFILALCFSIT